MKNRIPHYIPVSQLQHLPLDHQWDDWSPYRLIGENDKSTEQLLSRISNYGKFVYSLGCAEWVVARFNQHLDNVIAWQYLDACWAFEVSSAYTLPIELDDSEWSGPVWGPICLSLTTIINTRYGFDEYNAEIDSAMAEKVVLHVLPEHNIFKTWRDFTLKRMLELCAFDIQFPDGERLPMDVLDPHSKIKRDQFSFFLSKTIEELDIDNNPFVNRVE